MRHTETIELHPVVTDADAETYIDVRNRVEPADPVTGPGFQASRLRPDRLDLLALRRGVAVGMGFVGRNIEDPESAYAFGKVGVLQAEGPSTLPGSAAVAQLSRRRGAAIVRCNVTLP